MLPHKPEDWPRLFVQYLNCGDLKELASLYETTLAGIRSMNEFRHTSIALDADAIVPRDVRDRYRDLPESVEIRGREVVRLCVARTR